MRSWLEKNPDGTFDEALNDLDSIGPSDKGYFNSLKKKIGGSANSARAPKITQAEAKPRDEEDDWLDAADEGQENDQEGGGNTVADRYEKLETMAEAAAAGELTALHTIIYGSPGVGKTYTVLEKVKEGVKHNKTNHKWMVKSGNSGSSQSSVAALLYAYHEGWVLVLDDNDAMIDTKESSGKIANILKTVLEMNPKTVSIDSGIAKAKLTGMKYADELDTRSKNGWDNGMSLEPRPARDPGKPFDFDDKAKSLISSKTTGVKEGVLISFDKSRLNDNILSYNIGPRHFQEYIDDNEKFAFKRLFETGSLKPKNSWESKISRMREATNEDGDDDGEPEDAMTEEEMYEKGEAPDPKDGIESSFFFSSNVIFISNLTADRIDSAVLSRCNGIYLNLSAREIVEKMDSIFGNLGVEEGEARGLEKGLYDYCRRTVMAILHWAVMAGEKGRPILGMPLHMVNVDGVMQFPTSLQFRLMTAEAAVLYKYMTKNATRLHIPMNPKNYDKILKSFPITGGGRANYKSSSPFKQITSDICTSLMKRNADAKRSKA
jgi:hypothetical protein